MPDSGETRRAHAMPFGAAVLQEGGVRFRLWAPSARSVGLCLERGSGGSEELAMAREAAGFHAVDVSSAAPGDRYRFRIDAGELRVPDPASRRQAGGVHGPSVVCDPDAFSWRDAAWEGVPWERIVLYELHVGTFTPEGTFDAARAKLADLAALGVTAIELMPVADFPGRRNWGYDGVLPFAPASAYGAPDDLKRLVEAAHGAGVAVFLDVVYNHFGPEGNYLHAYAAPFFTDRHHTPWGRAIDFDGPSSGTVRDFFVHNALYWLEEFHIDGLRLDAVHAIRDDRRPGFLEELAAAVRRGPGASRRVHLVLENDDNAAKLLRGGPAGYDAQWNDDLHHALHVLLTGETGGYYADYAADPIGCLGRALAEGFAWQGEPSPHRGGALRGEPSADLPPTAFVAFLQNHDQVGNRAFGDRLAASIGDRALRAAAAVVLLSPAIPMLFMGEESHATTPFPFFCDFGPDLAAAVTEGRRREFRRFAEFRDAAARERIPDPSAASTFERAVLPPGAGPDTPAWRRWYREALAVRREAIAPRLPATGGRAGGFRRLGERALAATWSLGGGARLHLAANLGDEPVASFEPPRGRLLFASAVGAAPGPGEPLAAWSTAAWLDDGRARVA